MKRALLLLLSACMMAGCNVNRYPSNVRRTNPEKCPKCRAPTVEIIYGLPGSEETFQAAQEGKIRLGGCAIYKEMNTRSCSACDYEFQFLGDRKNYPYLFTPEKFEWEITQ